MTQLSICIPNYNRIECLNDCLNSILISSQNVENFNFEVCISDNYSDKNPKTLIDKYASKFKIKFFRNKENLGFALNGINSVKMASGKYVWMIGNDDLILPNTLSHLQKLFVSNPSVDYFFINSYLLNSETIDKSQRPFDTNSLKLSNLDRLSKVDINNEVEFWDIIDPKVSWEFLIGIFLSIFNREKWIKGLNCLNENDIRDKRIWSNFDNTCLNAKIISTVFNKSNCYICSEPLSVNIIGYREWTNLYDFVEIVRIPELLDYYRSMGMGLSKYLYCKNYALRNFFNFFCKILIYGDKSGRSYVNFKNHFFKNLIYPNAWLSILYYILRSINKVLVKK